MAHTYAAKNLDIWHTAGVPGTPGAYTVRADYYAAAGTLAETIAAIAGAAGASKELPVGSVITVKVLTGGSLALQNYLVTANTGSAVTLTEEKIA